MTLAGSPPSPTVMPRACISCGMPIPHYPHAPHCPRGRTATTPVRTRYKAQHGHDHQQRRKRMITPTSLCAWRYLGGCHGPLQLDYKIPLSMGGQATDANAQVLCERHNIAKGGRNRVKR